jgi:hypothetical protein
MRGNHLIAVCDILGFTELVRKHSLAEVVDDALGWFRKALTHSILQGDFPTEPPSIRDLDAHARIGVAWFSDTILLYTKEDSDDAVRELVNAVAWLLFETIVTGAMRIRGGIAYGEAHIDAENSLFVGGPIIDAYLLEKDQEWSGAALTPAAVERIPAAARTGRYADWLVTPWDVPLKGGGTRETLAANWNRGVHAIDWRMKWSRESPDAPPPEAWETMPGVCAKFVNTKRFHEAHCDDCKAGANPTSQSYMRPV